MHKISNKHQHHYMQIDPLFIGGNYLVMHLPNASYKNPVNIVQQPGKHFLEQKLDNLHDFFKSMLDSVEQIVEAKVYPIEVANPNNWLYKTVTKTAYFVAPHFLVDHPQRLSSLDVINMIFEDEVCARNSQLPTAIWS